MRTGTATEALLALLGGRRGHFSYESGHHGSLWLDLDSAFVRPRALAPYVDALVGLLPPVDAVCGPLVGGGFVAQALGLRLDVDCFYTGGPGYPLPPAVVARVAGQRIAVVDDVVNAGSAVGATLASVRAAGGVPVAVGALLVLGSAFAPDLPVYAVARMPHELWSESDCPLCIAGVPVDGIVSR